MGNFWGKKLTTNETIRVEIERITYRNQENGWTVLKGAYPDSKSEELVTVTGHFTSARPGEQFELMGQWTSHPKFGKQFKVSQSMPIRPSDSEAIIKYLSSGLIKGIGPKTAEKIVAAFGDETLEILDRNPDRLLEVHSIGKSKGATIIEAWKEQAGISDIMLFLSQHDISPLFAARILKFYGKNAIPIVRSNPYRLASDIQGIGFTSADKIAQSLGVALDSPERIRAGVVYQLQQAEEQGHCFLYDNQIEQGLTKTLELSNTVIRDALPEALEDLNQNGMVISESVVKGKKSLNANFKADLLSCELSITEKVKHLLEKPFNADEERIKIWLDRYTDASSISFSDEQINAIRSAVSNRFFVLTGGPGVGKTTTANAIIRLLKAMGKTVALGAPTGRAAQRLSEVSALPARTIHRMLEWIPTMHAFARNEDNPLTVQAVIIDEASMLDVRLASSLLAAIPDTAQVIFIGDADQLPSVGPGNLLRDLIKCSNVPSVRLKKIFRQAQASKIVTTAHAINTGDDVSFENSPKDDCHFYERDTGADIKEEIKQTILNIKAQMGLCPFNDIQILTPMNRGELGTITLNEELQNLLNPERSDHKTFTKGSLVLRPGDKVIQNANNYDLNVFNGDIGICVDTNFHGGKLLIRFGDRDIVYEDDQALDLRLAYAITIHKSQGSEFPAVIIPVSMQHYIMMQRNLIYTALTRARKQAVLVGSSKAFHYAINNQKSGKRQTRLIERIQCH